MNETKSLRLRSLLAFLVPVLFAVFLMQPTQIEKLVDLSQPPTLEGVGTP